MTRIRAEAPQKRERDSYLIVTDELQSILILRHFESL
jgi:hypothetical protein